MKIELLGGGKKEELEERIKTIAAAGKLSRFSGNVFEVLESCDNYEKNLKLIKRIIKMGHKSIIEHDYLVFAISDITPIVEQTIIGNRLTSFTVKSRREVDFRNVGFYIPEFRDNEGNMHKDNKKIKEKYIKHMKWLFEKYAELVDQGISKEDARFILPYCYNGNLIMGLDGRELEAIIKRLIYGKESNIAELKELGMKLKEIVDKNVPYLSESIVEPNKIENQEYIETLIKRPEIKILEKVQLLNFTPNPDKTVLEAHIMYKYQCTRSEAQNILKEMKQKDENIESKLMKVILNQNEKRELEQVNFQFQIPISLAVLTHLTRHRMHSLLIPDFVPMWNLENYIIPESIKKLNEQEYIKIYKKNQEIYNEIKSLGVNENDLVYFYLSGNMCNVITTINARTMQWISRLRCCNKAQWQIRNIVKDMVKLVRKEAPEIGKGLGATCSSEGICYEGKEYCGIVKNIIVK